MSLFEALVHRTLLQEVLDSFNEEHAATWGCKLILEKVVDEDKVQEILQKANPANERPSQQVSKYKYTAISLEHTVLFGWTRVNVECFNGAEYTYNASDFDWDQDGSEYDIKCWDFADYLPEDFVRVTRASGPSCPHSKIRVYYRGKYYKELLPTEVVLGDYGLDTPIGWKYI